MSTTDKPTGIPSGYNKLDEITGGWQPADLIVITDRTESSFSLTLAKNMAVDNNLPTAYFSMDLSTAQLVSRLLSNCSKIEESKILNDGLQADEWKRLDKGVNVLKDAPLYIDDTQDQSVDEVSVKIRDLKQEQDLNIAIIDNLQQIKGQGVIRSLKVVAQELNIPIIVLSQEDFGTEKDVDVVLSVNPSEGNTALVRITHNTHGNNGEVSLSLNE